MTEEIRHFRSGVPGAAVRDGRKALGWSEIRLARETGLAEGFIWRVERGRSMSPAEAAKIYDAFVRHGYDPATVSARKTAPAAAAIFAAAPAT